MTYAGYIEAQLRIPVSTTITATNNGGGPSVVSLTAGDYFISEYVAHLQTRLNAVLPGAAGATWTVTLSYTGTAPTGLVTFAMSAGTFTVAFTTAAAGTAIGFSASATSAAPTGAASAHGIWFPDRPLNCDDDPRAAPMLTDLRETESPTGYGLAVVGNAKYVHPNFRWARVAQNRYRDTDSGVTPSWERFVKNTQLGQGHAWFSPRSRIRIADHTAALVGNEAGVTKWWARGINRVTARKHDEAWTGAWLIEIPALVSDGS